MPAPAPTPDITKLNETQLVHAFLDELHPIEALRLITVANEFVHLATPTSRVSECREQLLAALPSVGGRLINDTGFPQALLTQADKLREDAIASLSNPFEGVVLPKG